MFKYSKRNNLRLSQGLDVWQIIAPLHFSFGCSSKKQDFIKILLYFKTQSCLISLKASQHQYLKETLCANGRFDFVTSSQLTYFT